MASKTPTTTFDEAKLGCHKGCRFIVHREIKAHDGSMEEVYVPFKNLEEHDEWEKHVEHVKAICDENILQMQLLHPPENVATTNNQGIDPWFPVLVADPYCIRRIEVVKGIIDKFIEEWGWSRITPDVEENKNDLDVILGLAQN